MTFCLCNNSEHGAEGLLAQAPRMREDPTTHTGDCGHGRAARVPQQGCAQPGSSKSNLRRNECEAYRNCVNECE